MAYQSRFRSAVGPVSLIIGPALMSVGDLIHPAESWNAATQAAIVAQHPTRWYAAHLLLFIGLLLFVPGILTLTELASDRRPKAGFVARVLMIAAVGALSAVFAFEMLLGRVVSAGADQRAATALLEAFQSGAVFLALMPGLLGFFIGVGLAVAALASTPGPFRWPALGLALGCFLIMGEIVLAIVLLSQIGNIINFIAGVGFARKLLRPSNAA